MSNSEFDLSGVVAWRTRRANDGYVDYMATDILRGDVWELFLSVYDGAEGVLSEASIPNVPCEELPTGCEYQRRQEVGDTVLISHSSCCLGDYGGCSSVGEANIRFLESEVSGCQIIHDQWSFRQAWIPDTTENRELLASLDNDPLLSEDEYGNVELEWEEEAWNNYVRSDLIRTLPEFLQEWADNEEDRVGSTLWECYRNAMESTNTYPVAEGTGMYVDIDRIEDDFAQEVATLAMEDSDWLASRFAAIPDCPVRETDDTSLQVALDWCEETGYSDMFIEFLRGWFARDDQNASKSVD